MADIPFWSSINYSYLKEKNFSCQHFLEKKKRIDSMKWKGIDSLSHACRCNTCWTLQSVLVHLHILAGWALLRNTQTATSVIYTLSDELLPTGILELEMSLAEAPWRAHKGHKWHCLQSSSSIPNLPSSFLAITVSPEILIINIHFAWGCFLNCNVAFTHV